MPDKDKTTTEPKVVEEVKEEPKKEPRLKPIYHCGLGFKTVIGYVDVETGKKTKVLNKGKTK